jgi:hypothetical protein
MVNQYLGANEFSFSGDRTRIDYLPNGPGPTRPGHEGGSLQYLGPEGDFEFSGNQIALSRGPLGTLVTVRLRLQDDAGGVTATILLPHVTGVARGNPVTFETLLVKASSRGLIDRPGPDLSYTIVPLLGTAQDAIQPAVARPSASSGESGTSDEG